MASTVHSIVLELHSSLLSTLLDTSAEGSTSPLCFNIEFGLGDLMMEPDRTSLSTE